VLQLQLPPQTPRLMSSLPKAGRHRGLARHGNGPLRKSLRCTGVAWHPFCIARRINLRRLRPLSPSPPPFLSFCETRAHAGSRESPIGTAPHRHGSCPSGQRCWRVRTRFVSERCPLGESRHRQFMEWVCLRRETPRSSSMSPGRRKSVADLPIKRSEPTSISKRKGSISGFIDALKDTGSAERCV
jgi:hypothetical protein